MRLAHTTSGCVPSEEGQRSYSRLRPVRKPFGARVEMDSNVAPTLLSLPQEVLARVCAHLDVDEDLIRVESVSKAFRDPSVVRHAARLRAGAAGCRIPALLPAREQSWTVYLCWRAQLARYLTVAQPDSRIAVSCTHSLLVDAGGDVLSFGSGLYGCLGHGDFELSLVPRRVEALRGMRACAVAAGRYSSLVLTDQGRVYSFGEGRGGKLGHGDTLDRALPRLIDVLRHVHVVSITSGDEHSIATDDTGAVWVWGRARSGCLGTGTKRCEMLPRRLKELDHVRICSAAAGNGRSCFIGIDGSLYLAGQGFNDSFVAAVNFFPTRVGEKLEHVRVRSVAVGAWHMVLLADDGSAYTWRDAEGMSPSATGGPTRLESMAGKEAVAVAAGDDHSLVITSEGSAYAFGLNDCGQLGVPEAIHSTQHIVDIRAFGPESHQHRAVAAAAGGGNTLVYTESGCLFAFGSGDDGRTGLGHTGETYEPSRVHADLRPAQPHGAARPLSLGRGRAGQPCYT